MGEVKGDSDVDVLERVFLSADDTEEGRLSMSLREIGLSDAEIKYTIAQRRRRMTPPPGTKPYRGYSDRWADFFGIHNVD